MHAWQTFITVLGYIYLASILIVVGFLAACVVEDRRRNRLVARALIAYMEGVSHRAEEVEELETLYALSERQTDGR